MKTNIIYAKAHLNSFQRRFEFLFWSLIHYRTSKLLFNFLTDIPLAKEIFYHHPKLVRKIFRRYLCCNMSTRKKSDSIIAHYSFVFNTFNDDSIRLMYSNGSSINLLTFVINETTLSAELCYNPLQEREGELMLQLLDTNKERLYSIAFSFFSTKNKISVFIGGIQGYKTDDQSSNEIIRILTKQMHGLRPRNFLIFILRIICNTFYVDYIEAVTTKNNITQCERRLKLKDKEKMYADYDLYWEEEGGIKQGNAFILPIQEKRKSFDEIKSNKRSMYAKRYAMMDDMATDIKEKLQNSMR